MSSARFNKLLAKYGGMGASIVYTLKELDDEHHRLMKMHAEECLSLRLFRRSSKKTQRKDIAVNHL